MSPDALLVALAETRKCRDWADEYIRALLAYARELSTTRPYSLVELAEAAGMAVSAVPTAYSTADIRRASALSMPPDSPEFRDYWHAITAMREDVRTRNEPD